MPGRKVYCLLILTACILLTAISCKGMEPEASRDASAVKEDTARMKLLRIFSSEIGMVEVRAEIAADPGSRSKGLMGRSSLQADTGMLFIFPYSAKHSFWMANVSIPLSIAFISDTGEIIETMEMSPGAGMAPEKLPHYSPSRPAKMALEMESGWFGKNRIDTGGRLELDQDILSVTVR